MFRARWVRIKKTGEKLSGGQKELAHFDRMWQVDFAMNKITLHQGHVLNILRTMPAESVHEKISASTLIRVSLLENRLEGETQSKADGSE
jgi:hypothetical protein